MLKLSDQGDEALPTTSERILQEVRHRSRICRALFNTAGIWFAVGVASFLGALILGRGSFGFFALIFKASEIIGLVIFFVALSVTYAIYRCPECGSYLSPFRPDKLRCPSCDVKVKES